MDHKNFSINKRENVSFFTGLFFIGVLCFFRYFEWTMTEYNTTLYAFSYKYGFISRALVGTLWQGLDRILPFSIMSYEWILGWNVFLTFLTLFLYGVIFYEVICRVNTVFLRTVKALFVLLWILLCTEFWGDELFGRLDLYLFLLEALCILCILRERGLWRVPLYMALMVLIHQGAVFTNVNMILVLLFYLHLSRKEKKYLGLFGMSFLVASGLFLYFEFISHGIGSEFYDEIVGLAKSLSYDGKSFNQTILDHELLGLDVSEREAVFRVENLRELPVAIVLLLPVAFPFFREWYFFMRENKKTKAAVYGLFVFGWITLLPEFFLKVDYGRYFFLILFYVLLLLLYLMAVREPSMESYGKQRLFGWKSHRLYIWGILLYACFMVPFYDVIINRAVYLLTKLLMGYWI